MEQVILGAAVDSGTFYAIAGVLGVAALVGVVFQKLRQPLIVAYIAVGIIVGPVGMELVTGGDEIDLLARLGIAILLFLVGLKLDLGLVRSTGPVAVATGLGQVVFTSLVGFAIALGLGLDPTTALYVAIALTFSSTIIIVKLLSDKRELEQLHGRIAIGFLIVQDLVVVLVMIGLTAVGQSGGRGVVGDAASVIGKGAVLLLLVGVMMRVVLPWFMRSAASSGEMIVLASVAWAVGLAAFTDWLGFSTEVGAFLAGVSLAPLEYRDAIGARLVSLRDFLLLFFFVDLGARLEFSAAPQQAADAAVLSAFVLIGNPIIVMTIMGVMGYRKRVSFLAGLTVAQISEFSLILVGLGITLGHVPASTMTLVTLVGLITIGLSTYMITYSHGLYNRLARVLTIFERAQPRALDVPADTRFDIILFGLGRYGSRVARHLVAAGHSVLAVDFDPHASTRFPDPTVPVVYGDAEEPEFPAHLPLASAQWVVSAIPVVSTNLALAHALRSLEYSGRIAVTASSEQDRDRFRDVDLVLMPFDDAAERVVALLGTAPGEATDRSTGAADAAASRGEA